MKMRPLKMDVYGMWWSLVLGTGIATISMGVLLCRVDWATVLQSNHHVFLVPELVPIRRMSNNIRQPTATHPRKLFHKALPCASRIYHKPTFHDFMNHTLWGLPCWK